MTDIQWHGWKRDKMEEKGNYLVLAIVDSDVEDAYSGAWTVWTYWDGKSEVLYGQDSKEYLIRNVIEWAYDGDCI